MQSFGGANFFGKFQARGIHVGDINRGTSRGAQSLQREQANHSGAENEGSIAGRNFRESDRVDCDGFCFSSRRRHTRFDGDWSSDVSSSDLNRGYAVFPINPAETAVEGHPAFKSVLDVPGPIDMATFYVPCAIGVQVLDEVVKKGIREVWLDRKSVV